MRKKRLSIVKRVFSALREAGDWVWIREIARMADLHPEEVRRVIDRDLREAVVETQLPVRLRLVKLREGVSLERHLVYVKLMEKTGHRATRSFCGT